MERQPSTNENLSPSEFDLWEQLRGAELRQDEALPKGDLTAFANNEWVALREGIVIGHAKDYIALRDNPFVLDTDVALFIPAPEDDYAGK